MQSIISRGTWGWKFRYRQKFGTGTPVENRGLVNAISVENLTVFINILVFVNISGYLVARCTPAWECRYPTKIRGTKTRNPCAKSTYYTLTIRDCILMQLRLQREQYSHHYDLKFSNAKNNLITPSHMSFGWYRTVGWEAGELQTSWNVMCVRGFWTWLGVMDGIRV